MRPTSQLDWGNASYVCFQIPLSHSKLLSLVASLLMVSHRTTPPTSAHPQGKHSDWARGSLVFRFAVKSKKGGPFGLRGVVSSLIWINQAASLVSFISSSLPMAAEGALSAPGNIWLNKPKPSPRLLGMSSQRGFLVVTSGSPDYSCSSHPINPRFHCRLWSVQSLGHPLPPPSDPPSLFFLSIEFHYAAQSGLILVDLLSQLPMW